VRTAEPILVLGAGAIGSLYAAKLAARHPVTVVARPGHVEAIRLHGLRLTGREALTARVEAVTHVDAIAAGTIILLTTKVNDSEAAVGAVADRLRDDTIIVCVQNGLHSEEIARRAARGRCLVLRAITQFGAIFQAPGVVEYMVAGHTLIETSPESAAIADRLSACGLDGRVSGNIKVEVWRKLIFNCVINPITSITGSDVGAIADPRLDSLKRLVVDECLEVARTEGVAFEVDFVRTIADVFGTSRNIASMRQDLMRGKPTEIDHMNGAVVDLGRRSGIACPVNAALVAIIKAMAQLRYTMSP
jgi:2-dehydropantoate 2-reductase